MPEGVVGRFIDSSYVEFVINMTVYLKTAKNLIANNLDQPNQLIFSRNLKDGWLFKK